ncbi:hypothetical protein ACS5PN_22995 [Roseateles sp. NT4]|uniref:hypothetical protein n=1 Tax=Roseateles sp. NT4 TaxID=3453715 RepID=UPI003EE9D2F9
MDHRWIARGLVAALHLGLLAALWMHKPPSLGEHADRRVTTVRLIALPQPRVPQLIEKEPPRNIGPHITLPPRVVVAPPPVPDTVPAPAPVTPVAPAPSAEPPRTTLRLALPPGYAASSAAARNPALNDPRSNTPRPTFEDRIADATGGAGAWVEESTSENRSQAVGAQGDRRTVMRRGDTCVEIFRSRIADVDQFNGSVAPRAISMVGKPYKCK